MVKIECRDITEVDFGIVAHGVNCQGAMGSGVALAIRNKWDIVYAPYRTHISKHLAAGHKIEQLLGQVSFVSVSSDVVVANCFTQLTYGYDGKRYASLAAVVISLSRTYDYARMHGLPVYLPKIGSDRGGLSWENEVYPAIVDTYMMCGEHPTTICVIE